MSNRPDFEGIEADLDADLLMLYRQWRTNRLYWADDEQPDTEDKFIEEFISDVRNRLTQLLKNNNGGTTQ
jgi:hypothetical protein